MVNEELSASHRRIEKKQELYLKAIEKGKFISNCGNIIFFISVIIILLIAFLKINIESLIEKGIIVGFFLGAIISFVGTIIQTRAEKTIDFPLEEVYFLSICESLGDIESYQKNKIELSRFEATKKLTKFEKEIREPAWKVGLWDRLTKEENENLYLLKRNINERLIPNINKGNEEEVKKAYSVLEKLAQYILSPTISELINLNKSMSDFKIYSKIKPSIRPYFFHPYMIHTYFFVVICGISYIVYRLGISMNASIDGIYLGTIGIFGALLAGYLAFIIKK